MTESDYQKLLQNSREVSTGNEGLKKASSRVSAARKYGFESCWNHLVTPIRFTIPVAPIGAPRMTQRDRWAKRPCVVRYFAWKDAVRPHLPANLPKNPTGVSWTAYFPFPKSYSAKKRKELAGQYHQEKFDRDNIDKALLDLMFEQDKGVAFGTICKRWDDGLGPRIEIEVTP